MKMKMLELMSCGPTKYETAQIKLAKMGNKSSRCSSTMRLERRFVLLTECDIRLDEVGFLCIIYTAQS